ncbi:MAG TPA: hypothetical protein VKV27_09520 [Solirubrobacteraceae bacterium]|nr:hypothetical protein [Solirubrobacteraceae bacterium]
MGTRQPTIADLRRWVQFGAGVRIVKRRGPVAVYELCTCTGETVERHESADDELISFLVANSPDRDTAEA